MKSLHHEVIGWRHEPEYVFDNSMEREVHILLADGVEVFADRSHDAVVAKCREITGSTYPIELFGDLDDPDKYWNLLKES